MLRMPFLQCIGPLVVGLVGLTVLRRKWGQPEAVLGGILLGGLGMWFTWLMLFFLNWVGDKLLVLAEEIDLAVAGASTVQAAVTGAWLAFTRLLVFEVAALLVFIALFGLGVGRAGSVAAGQSPVPMSDSNMPVGTPLRGFALWLMPLSFTWLLAPLFGAALAVALSSGRDTGSVLVDLIRWFPTATAVLVGATGMLLALCSSLQAQTSK